MLTSVREFDCVFISYDELCADLYYADLLTKCPTAKRVHGIHGFDAAHKHAANISDTDFFITVDVDTIVDKIFWDEYIDTSADEQWCFLVRNSISGLSSGNGSVKIWKKSAILESKTHECAEDVVSSLDFWQSFNVHYLLTHNFGVTYPNSSPLHAFRSGFREVFKATIFLNDINLLKKYDILSAEMLSNTIETWTSVGLDSKYGIYSMYGARVAAYLVCTGYDNHIKVIADYKRMGDLINSYLKELPSFNDLLLELDDKKYTDMLSEKLNIKISSIPANACVFFKAISTMDESAIYNLLDQFSERFSSKQYSHTYNIKDWSFLALSAHDCEQIYNIINKA